MIKYIKLLLDKILFSSIDPLMKIGKKDLLMRMIFQN